MKKKLFTTLKNITGVLLLILVIAINFSPQMRLLKNYPDNIYVDKGETKQLPFESNFMFGIDIEGEDVIVSNQSDQTLSEAQGISVQKEDNTVSTIHFNLFGLLPIKSVHVRASSGTMLVPGGSSIGVTLYTKGALIVGISDIETETGEVVNPAQVAGLRAGDIIEKINGITIQDASHMSKICNERQGSSLLLEILREGKSMQLTIKPVKDGKDGKMRMGLWVRDSTAGVGTLTFYDPETGWFGALGHAIVDIDTKSTLNVKTGEILESNIIDIVQGTSGEPGELKGTFDDFKTKLGSIEKNTECGIFGKMYNYYKNPLYNEALPAASQNEIKRGEATLLTTLDNKGIRAFKCEIQRITYQQEPSPKGFIVKITDEELLKKTGGIVQGMSGSPVIQNGKIIGAITHVFINDPTRGYGIYIEWMLKQIDSEELKIAQ